MYRCKQRYTREDIPKYSSTWTMASYYDISQVFRSKRDSTHEDHNRRDINISSVPYVTKDNEK